MTTTSQATGDTPTPTGELPITPSPTPRTPGAAAPDTLRDRIKRGQAERLAAQLERHASTYQPPDTVTPVRHRLGDRAGQIHSIRIAPVGARRPDARTTAATTLLARLLGGAQ